MVNRMKEFLLKYWVRILISFLVILFITLFVFRDRIAENKIVKAKMDIFNAGLEGDTAKVYEIIDSVFGSGK